MLSLSSLTVTKGVGVKIFKSLLLICSFVFLFSSSAFSQENPIVGKWKTIDDKSGEAKSVIEIYEQDGKLYGKVVELFNEPDQVCDLCTDNRKDQKVLGMQIIDGLTKTGKKWGKGKILDPGDGKFYDCQIWLDGDQLRVRGYILFLFRTQTWVRA